MKPNKKLFFSVVEQVSAACRPEGFVEHPTYVSGWEPANQAYEASLIRLLNAEFIDQLEICFYPSLRSFSFDVTRIANSFGFTSVDDIPQDAGLWTESWLYQPFDRYSLLSGQKWNPFSQLLQFRIGKRQPIDVDAEAAKISQRFERNSKYLYGALSGTYKGQMVHVAHYEIERPQ